MNAFVAAPQCSPSRAAILTGRNIWQLEEAGTHSSYFPKKFPVFTDVLREEGYAVGYTGKAWGPGNWADSGWEQNPVGKEYNEIRFDSLPTTGLSPIDYASNFQVFLNARESDEPFFFWFGAHEPHRVYEYGSGQKLMEDQSVRVPPFLPEDDSIRIDMLDHAFEISWFDQQLAEMLTLLETRGELKNTIVVVTADNGMPFPFAKANLQERGIHVPLAICGPSIPGGRRIEELVSLIDLAPTFLEIAGAGVLDSIPGKSLVPILRDSDQGTPGAARRFVLSGRERHTHARPDNNGYPARAMRTKDFLYVRNFKPDRWPLGDPPPNVLLRETGDPEIRPVVQGYEDIDDSPTKRVMIAHDETWPEKFAMAFGMRGEEQLYDIRHDPECLKDLAPDPAYRETLAGLRSALEDELLKQGDPRVTGTGDVFDTYPRFGRMRAFPGFREKGKYRLQTSH